MLGDASHLGFEQVADRKQRPGKLFLRKLAEKITLILVRITSREQFVDRPTVGCRLFGLATVVSRSHEIGTQLEGFLQKNVELNFAVAEHVRVGCTPFRVFGEHIVHHPATVLVREIDRMERNVEPPRDKFGEEPVVVPGAVAFERTRSVVPVDHEESDNLMPGLLEQVGRYRRIDAAGESDNHTCHTFCANFTFRPHRKARFAGNIRSRKHRFSTDSRYSSISPSGSTIFTVRPSKSMPAMNSSTAGTRIRLPPISTSKRGLASLS